MKNITIQSEIEIDLPILAQERYLKTKSSKFGWLADDYFIIPYFLDTRLIFTRMVFTYGLIAKKDGLTIVDEQNFLDKMVNFVKTKKLCDFIYKAQSNVIFSGCPKGSDCVEWGSYVVNLSLSEEDLLKNMHSKHRNVVRKAIKDGVVIKKSDDIELVQKIIADTMKRQNVIHYPSLEYMQNLYKNIPDNLALFIAHKDGVVQGVALFVYDKVCSYYMYGGSIPKPHIGSLNLLHYEAMKYFKNLGLQKYDFVGARINFKKGSKYEGLDRFKNRFGGALNKGYSFRYIINPLKFKLFNILSKSYLKLKGYEYIDPIDSIRGKK